MNWSDLIGKTVAAFRGHTHTSPYSKKKVTPLEYILFDDCETFIELDEQDPYDYHDCNNSARLLTLRKDAALWQKMFDKELNFNEPDNVGSYPF